MVLLAVGIWLVFNQFYKDVSLLAPDTDSVLFMFSGLPKTLLIARRCLTACGSAAVGTTPLHAHLLKLAWLTRSLGLGPRMPLGSFH